jgi:hypothetical protein
MDVVEDAQPAGMQPYQDNAGRRVERAFAAFLETCVCARVA